MPLRNGKLTRQERVFAENYARTGDKTASARIAGYSHADTSAARVAVRPPVLALVEELFTGELIGEILPLALKRHRQILSDPKSTGPMLTKAIETAYKYGFAKRESGADKELHEMTMEELQALIKASDVAKLIEGQVVEVEPEPSPLDEFG